MNARLIEMIERVKQPLAQVALIAHRGGSKIAPENTIPAFESSLAIHADMIEFDVHLTKDKKIVVHHNFDTEWLGFHNVELGRATYGEILRCRFDPLFGEEYKGIRIPLLEDVLMILKGKTIPVIEIKVGELYREDLENILIEALRQFNFIGEAVIVSFDMTVLRRTKEKEPGLCVGRIISAREDLEKESPDWLDALVVFYEILDAKILGKLNRAGKTVIVWTVNEERNMRRYAEMGVDGIASDDPILLKKVLTGHY